MANLKRQLSDIADRTNRGFNASGRERARARKIISELAQCNPSSEPVKIYYSDRPTQVSHKQPPGRAEPSLAGKWTLLYTNAPDITGLEGNCLATLGRIGQECQPPYIKNVIEWKRPAWASGLPLSGTEDTRVLQKVVTQAIADPAQPAQVQLELAGLQVHADRDDDDSRDLVAAVRQRGLIAGLLSMNPLDWKGPVDAPFGQFEVLYLDDDLRIIQTNQGYLAANVRITSAGDEWF